MNRPRIIPVLLIKNQGLYKTIKFGEGKYIGDPINAVKIFNEKQCDEIIFIDILATKERKGINFRLIEQMASECFMPLSYGGGIGTNQEIEKLLKIGVERVVLNNILNRNPSFLNEAVRNFGTSTIVSSIDIKRNLWGKYYVYDYMSKKNISSDIVSYLKQMEEMGAGEIFLNCVDLDGTMKGYDLEIAKTISGKIEIPITLCGGAKDFDDMRNLLINTQISAASAGSMFVFHGPHNGVLINYPDAKLITNLR
jgi:cyclase